MSKEKTCPTCKCVFPLTSSYYYVDSSKSSGFRYQCRDCDKRASNSNYLKKKNKKSSVVV